MVLFKRETIVSDFLFKLVDREKFVHNCNRQNIHVAETTCTPASAIFCYAAIQPSEDIRWELSPHSFRPCVQPA